MKLIIAYIQPYQLRHVKEELFKNKVYKMSVTNALGCGEQAGYTSTWRGIETTSNLLKKIRLEIGVNDEFVDTTIDAIIKGSQSGKIGDGKIFVLPIEQSIRIRNNERGSKTIG